MITDIFTEEKYRIVVTEAGNVDIKISPLDAKKMIFYETHPNPTTFFLVDPVLDYHNLQITLETEYDGFPEEIEVQKKNILVNYTLSGTPEYREPGENLKVLGIFPRYDGSIFLEPGEYFLNISYESFSPRTMQNLGYRTRSGTFPEPRDMHANYDVLIQEKEISLHK